jgi:hypothetical protein
LADALSDAGIRIVDSLELAPTTFPLEEFLQRTLSIIIVKPDNGRPADLLMTQREGMREMDNVRTRLKTLKRDDN